MAATVWRGGLVFGPVVIPVHLYKGARREPIPFHHVYQVTDGAASAQAASGDSSALPPNVRQFPAATRFDRVHNLCVGADSTPIAREDIYKGYEIERDVFVGLKPSEITALAARTSANLVITHSIGRDDIDLIYLDASYYVAPDRGSEKAYALLYAALREKRCAAVGELAMHSREFCVIIRPGERGLILHTLFFPEEVRPEDEPRADDALIDEKELELAKMLVEAQRAPFDVSGYKDGYKERILGLIDSRVREAAHGNGTTHGRQPAPVVDIKEALREAIDTARKPAKGETAKRPGRKKDKRPAK